MPSELYQRLDQLAVALGPDTFMLIGGLMVHCHAERSGILHARPTDDADLVIEIRTSTYVTAATTLESLGFERHLPADAKAPFHRFTRGDEHVDLMVAEDQSVRFAGRSILQVPGSRSALRRTIPHALPSGTVIRLPDIESALSLKGAAHRQPGTSRVRHLQDGVTLFACAGAGPLTVSKSMRANINSLIRALDTPEAWAFSEPPHRRRAIGAIRHIRPEWNPPAFILPTRHRA